MKLLHHTPNMYLAASIRSSIYFGLNLNPVVYQRRRHSFLRVSEEVRSAINARKPVVALETTIYTHGFPHPENAALATNLEYLVRKNGAIPATIGVLNGVARVGFTPEELNELTASAGGPDVKKLSRRDLGYICGLGFAGRRLNGGTTVAGTMALAALAGIQVFATGGLGGVHRGGETSLDISADLTELGRTPVAVVSSGCKSFLDISRTLEFLETQGVCVGTFLDGRRGNVDFPAFWTRESGFPSPLTIKDEKEGAAILYAHLNLGLSSGLLFANPIAEKDSIAEAKIDATITQALEEAKKLGIEGSENTPFVLKRIREISHGETVTANISLVKSNVIRGTKVAAELAKLYRQSHESPNRDPGIQVSPSSIRLRKEEKQTLVPPTSVSNASSSAISAADVIVAGAVAVDLSCDFIPPNQSADSISPQLQTSNPAIITQSLGGVGQNVATALHYLGASVHLCSMVADDIIGSAALTLLAERGLSTSGVKVIKQRSRTAQYIAINNARKDLVLAMADMQIMEDSPDFNLLWKPHLTLCKPKWLIVDANWDNATLHEWIKAGKKSGAKIAYEPVSKAKSKRLFIPQTTNKGILNVIPHHHVDLATPNSLELASMYAAAQEARLFDREDWWEIIDAMGLSASGSRDKLVAITNTALVDEGVPQQSIQLLPFIPTIVTKLGDKGVLVTQLLQQGDSRLISSPYILSRSDASSKIVGGVFMRLFPSVECVPEHQVISVNGVGDTFLGVLIAGLLKMGEGSIETSTEIAQKGSVMTLKSKEAVSSEISTLRSLLETG